MPWIDLLPTRLVGGFEGSTMLMSDGRRVDAAAGNRHDVLFEYAYDLLRDAGVRTVRESLRWHRLHPRPGLLLANELVDRLRALRARGMTAIWSLTQFGIPKWLDIWSSAFPDAFAEYAAFLAKCFRDECDEVPIWAPMNEISYWSWAGGSVGEFYPCARGRGAELKQQLAAAAIQASQALRQVDPRARLLHIDPLVSFLPDCETQDTEEAMLERSGMFEAWDMLRGGLHPELGGSPELLDLVGVNFYPENQRFADGSMVMPNHPSFVPFHRLASRVARRYGRPILVTETGTEGVEGVGWLRYMGKEMHRLAAHADLVGMTIYPVMDYPGWADDRHCACGLIQCDDDWQVRELRTPYVLAAAAAELLWSRGQRSGAAMAAPAD